jgi:hypothetical protein
MYLTVDQAHYPINATTPNGFTNPNELVEGGQLLTVRILPPVAAVPAMPNSLLALFGALLGIAGILSVRRARFETRYAPCRGMNECAIILADAGKGDAA